MEWELLFAVLMALISFALGQPDPLTEQEILDLLATVREKLDGDVKSLKQVIEIMDKKREVWFCLVTRCHYILKHKSALPAHLQACEYLKEHDCLVALEMQKVCVNFENVQQISTWLGQLKKFYHTVNAGIEHDPRSEEISLCLGRLHQIRKVQSHKQRMKFDRFSLFVFDDTHVDPSCAQKLESIAKIAQEYEETVVRELQNTIKGNLIKPMPDIEKACEKVEEEQHRLDVDKAYKTAILKMSLRAVDTYSEQMIALKELIRASGATVPSVLHQTYQMLNAETMAPKFEKEWNEWMEIDDSPDLREAYQKRDLSTVVEDAVKASRNEIARYFLTVDEKPSNVTSKQILHITEDSHHPEGPPYVRYMCNIIKRQKEYIMAGK